MTANARIAWAVGLAVLVALPFVYRDPYHLHLLILILIWSFAYTSWSMMGRFGLVSLGHGGFMGVGAYVTALLWNHLGVSPWIGIPIALVCAGALALVVAYPCFRFRITGHYFVLVTLALSGIVLQVITATRDYTGGSLGYTPERTKGNHLLALQFDDKTVWYLIALGVWIAGLLIWRWVDRSMDRYALEAISEDEDAAAAAGVNVTAEKLKVTLISALMSWILIEIVVVAARRYGIERFSLELVMSVLVLEVVPLMTALFVALRSGAAIGAEIAIACVRGDLDDRAEAESSPLHVELVPRIAGAALSVAALTTIGCLVTVWLAYTMFYGFTSAGMDEFSRIVANVFDGPELAGFILKCLLFGFAVAVIPAAAALEAERGVLKSLPAVVLGGLVKLFFVIAVIQVGSLMVKYA